MRKLITVLTAGLFIGGIALLATSAQAQSLPFKHHRKLPVITLAIGIHTVHAAVAANEADRQQGLMHRTSLGPNEGMLFVFDESAQHCFWMKNTKLPLSIAFIDDHGTITDITEMKPETMANHCPIRAGRYALEMNRGWFAAKGIQPGMAISGLPAWQETFR